MLRQTKYKKSLLKQALKKPSIFWDIHQKDIKNLSEEALMERILNYGDIDQLRNILKNKPDFINTYSKIREKKRCNLFPEVINYIDIYIKNNA